MVDGKLQIKEIFTKDHFFVIPKYQRSYSWEESQIKDFFNDFKENYKETINYYYGTLLIYQPVTNKDEYEIVDGQQRITTLIIFMYCLLERINNMEQKEIEKNGYEKRDLEDIYYNYIKNKGKYKLELQQQEASFFSHNIIEEKGKNAVVTPAQSRLMHAKMKFQEWLTELSEEEVFVMLKNIESARMLVYTIKDKDEAAMIFETTNDRGKSLTNLEKIKSYLMYKVSSTLIDSSQKLNYIEQSFRNIYIAIEDISKIVGIDLNEDDVIRYSFIANEKWKGEGKRKPYQKYMEILKQEVDNRIQRGNILKKQMAEKIKNEKDEQQDEKSDECYSEFRDYVENYIINLGNSFDNLKEMLSDTDNEEINDLKATEHMASFYPLLIKCYSFDNSEDKTKYKEICRLCEIYSFRVYVIGDKLGTKSQTTFYNLARDFQGDFSKLSSDIVEMIKNDSSEKNFIENLENYDFYNIYNSLEKNYFFWKYENYLRTNFQPKANKMTHKELWEKKNKKYQLTIEHVVAQGNDLEKQKVICNADVIDTKTFDEQYLNSIGNLTLDPCSANSSKGAKDVEEKNSKYFKKAAYKSQLELEEFLKDSYDENGNIKKKWTIESIEERKNKLIAFARETWCKAIKQYETEEKLKEENHVDNLITAKQYMCAYRHAKMVNNNNLKIEDAVKILSTEVEMNESSAYLYIKGICNIFNGVPIGADINAEAIKYVIKKIFAEGQKDDKKKALDSLSKYLESKNRRSLRKVRNIYNDYLRLYNLQFDQED